MTAPTHLGRAGQGKCLLAEHHPGVHSYELRNEASAAASSAVRGGAGLGATLQRRIAWQGATPAHVARVLTRLLGGRLISAAELDGLPVAEALVLDLVLERWART